MVTEQKLNSGNRLAVVDIGSSYVRLLIAEKNGQAEPKILEYMRNPVTIGKTTFGKGTVSRDAINQTISIIQKYQKVILEYAVDRTITIATTATREAINKDIFVDTILHKTGLKVSILQIGDIVYYVNSYLDQAIKNKYPLAKRNLLIAVLSSASVEISIMEKGNILFTSELPIGALRINQLISDLDGSQQEVQVAIRENIEKEFNQLKRNIPIQLDDIILIDENFSPYLKNILKLKQKNTRFFSLGLDSATQLLSLVSASGNEAIAAEFNIPLDIANSMTAYALILQNLYILSANQQLYVLEISLSEVILNHELVGREFPERYNKHYQLIAAAEHLCKKFNVNLLHARYVSQMSQKLFESLRELMGLQAEDISYLLLAAQLHDIGNFIHARSHHKHSEYIISFLTLYRLTEEESKVIACIARYHRKAAPNSIHPLFSSLPESKRILVQKLSAILRIANALDSSHKQKLKKLEVICKDNFAVDIIGYTAENFILEKVDFNEKKEYFEEITGNKIRLLVKGY